MSRSPKRIDALARQQPQQGAAERRLAGAGFADDADGLALRCSRIEMPSTARSISGSPPRKPPPMLERRPRHSVPSSTTGALAGGGALRAGRLGRQQHLGVGMLRVGEDRLRLALLDHLALAHDIDAVGEAPHDAEIVGDEDDRHAELALQLGQQHQDLRLDGDVERRRRLVGDQDVGVVGERHGDHHALALAARHFVRIGFHPPLGIGNMHQPQQLERLLARLGAHSARDAGGSARSAGCRSNRAGRARSSAPGRSC